jgi:hypothetical protein
MHDITGRSLKNLARFTGLSCLADVQATLFGVAMADEREFAS